MICMSLSSQSADLGRQSLVAVKVLLVLTLVLGVVYPVAVWGVGRIGLAGAACHGSCGIGQSFPVEGDGWFHGRPSPNDYDGLASGPSNLGPSNADLLADIEQRRSEIARVEGVDPADVPADAVTGSGSGLDPDISPAYANLQIARVAAARELSVAQVGEVVDHCTAGRGLGFLGEPAVSVLCLNRTVARLR